MQIQPCGPLRGEITVPGDKSISHRAVMLGALANGTTHITGFLMGEDCLSTIDCFRKMGVEIEITDSEVIVEGVGLHGLCAPEETLYTGNSGTTTRLLCGILAGQPFTATLNGDASIQKRPMGRVIKPLREMGASIEGKNDNYCPLTLYPSELYGIEYRLPVASAQLKSAILLAGLYAEGQTTVIEPAPSRDHTERMFRALGVEVETYGSTITLEPPEDLYAVDIRVAGSIFLPRALFPRSRARSSRLRADDPERWRQSDAHRHSGRAARDWGQIFPYRIFTTTRNPYAI